MFFIKEMPKSERPRERLINQGVESLSNVELLAILLRTGNKDKSVIELSKDVYYHLEKIQDLQSITVEELMIIPGIKKAKATTIIAAIELGRRMHSINKFEKLQIKSTNDVYRLMNKISSLEQEHFYCLFLDTKLNLIRKELIFIGTNDKMVIHPREVFKKGIKYNASFVIFVHNHPTGDSQASKADIRTTEILEEASYILGINMLDHVIIGKNEAYSIKEMKKIYY